MTDLLEPVQQKLAEFVHDQCGEVLRDMETTQVLRKPYSTTSFLRVVTNSGNHHFVLKQIIRHPVNAAIVANVNQAIVEFEVIRDLYPKFAQVEYCSVPRPIAVFPEHEAFVMEYVSGRLLDEELRYARYFANRDGFRTLADHFYYCGRWLRYFQQFSGFRTAGVEALENILTRCDDRLRRIEEAGDRHCPKDLRPRVQISSKGL